MAPELHNKRPLSFLSGLCLLLWSFGVTVLLCFCSEAPVHVEDEVACLVSQAFRTLSTIPV